MSHIVIQIENLSKQYRLGMIGGSTLRADLSKWWARQCGLPDPTLKIGKYDHGKRNGEQIWALQDINFEVKQGEVLGIIGHNGAGKSTLLKILSRVTSPTAGNVRVKGRIASLLEVGTGFHPELTGRENIYLNGAILGMRKPEIDYKLDSIIDFSGVNKFIDTPVKRYSSGMYVRLAFSVAAHLEPEILLVDEVLAVGDSEFQQKCLGKMKDVAGSGRTVLFVSHNLAAVRYLCPRTILIDKGTLSYDGLSVDSIAKYMKVEAGIQLPASRNISAAPRVKGSGAIRLTRISLKNLQYELATAFAIWQPFIIEFDALSTITQSSVSFWVLISSTDGTVVLSTFQYDTLEPVTIYTPLCSIQVTIDPNELTPGFYTISVGAFGRYNEFLDWVEQAITFEIKEEFYSSKPFDKRLGLITSKFSWKLKQIDPVD